jgi:predicted ATPase
MKITKVYLKNFRRFTELTIDSIPNNAKLVMLVGPNGCGKSSVFDAFERLVSLKKPGGIGEQVDYYRKDPTQPMIIKVFDDNNGEYSIDNISIIEPTLFYIRSPYRYSSEIRMTQINPLPEIKQDDDRPKRTIDLDSRLIKNYQRLIVEPISKLYKGELDEVKGKEIREKYLKEINNALIEILGDIQISNIGDPLDTQRSQLYFSKGVIKEFSFKNLGSGEKEVIDMVVDLIIKKQIFNNTVFCIDEPDLHINTAIQTRLLKKLLEIIPENSQLWISTHSLGFIRETIELYRKSNGKEAVILDFSDKDFDQNIEIKPLIPTPSVTRKLFKVALEDLSSMVIPSKIYFCEGKSSYDTSQQLIQRTEFDAKVLDKIFYDQDVIFFSSGGKNEVQKVNQLHLKIIKEAGGLREIYSIIDRDNISDDERNKKISNEPSLKIWSRKEIENYLFDKEVIESYCKQNSLEFSSITAYNKIQDINKDDIKPYQSSIMQQCGFSGSVDEFKLKLCEFITPQTSVYKLLKKDLGL